jgi:alpha-amylase
MNFDKKLWQTVLRNLTFAALLLNFAGLCAAQNLDKKDSLLFSTQKNNLFFSAPAKKFAAVELYNGNGFDVMLQGFNWTSNNQAQNGKPWYQIISENSTVIKNAGFTIVWFPPPTGTVDNEGYLPNQWYNLNTRYGTQTQLQTAIQSLRPAISIADIVINHRNGTATGGADFTNPSFANNSAGVVRNDECNCGTGSNDSGEGFNASRDLDHSNASVRTEIIRWENFLKNTIGFAGWRYDLVKGYGGSFVGTYNDGTRPTFSVGEYFDGDRQNVVNWIDATGGKSTAFDFPTRFLLKDALAFNDYSRLKTIDGKPTGVIGWWSAMSVTFVENHDTEEVRNNGLAFPGDKTQQAYAYILTHPGIPCVFWRDYFDSGDLQKQKINTLIQIRKRNAINSRSVVNIRAADGGRYAATIDDRVAMKIGPGAWSPGTGWRLALDGNDYAVWEK